MSTIVTRTSKGSPLSWIEADANLTNLNTDKLEASALTPYLTSATAASTYETQTHASSTYETQTHASSTYPTKANNLSDLASASTARTNLGLGTAATQASTAFATSGAVTSNGNTMSTAKLIGRSTAGTGALEEITVGTGLSLSAGTLTSTSGLGLLPAMIRLNGANGYGSTNIAIRRFTTTITNQGTDITHTDSASLGAYFTINTAGVYSVTYSDMFNTASGLAITLNDSSPTVTIASMTTLSQVLSSEYTAGNNDGKSCSWTGYLPVSSVIRAHTDGYPGGSFSGLTNVTIQRVA